MAVQIVNNIEEFNNIISSGKVVFFDFFATWCGPCKMLSPELDKVAAHFEGKDVIIAKGDVDQISDLAAKYAVYGVPTMFMFKGSDVPVTKIGGFRAANQIIQVIEENL